MLSAVLCRDLPDVKGFVCLTVHPPQHYEKKEVSECLESTAERRARRNRDIKALFQKERVIKESKQRKLKKKRQKAMPCHA